MWTILWESLLRPLTTRVGQTTIILVGAVLVVGLISYSLIEYGENRQREKIEAQQNEQVIDTRKRIDEAIRNSKSVGPDNDREWLLERNRQR